MDEVTPVVPMLAASSADLMQEVSSLPQANERPAARPARVPPPPLAIDLASVRDVDELMAMGTPRLKAALV